MQLPRTLWRACFNCRKSVPFFYQSPTTANCTLQQKFPNMMQNLKQQLLEYVPNLTKPLHGNPEDRNCYRLKFLSLTTWSYGVELVERFVHFHFNIYPRIILTHTTVNVELTPLNWCLFLMFLLIRVGWKMPNCAKVKSSYHGICQQTPFQTTKQFLKFITKAFLFANLETIMRTGE